MISTSLSDHTLITWLVVAVVVTRVIRDTSSGTGVEYAAAAWRQLVTPAAPPNPPGGIMDLAATEHGGPVGADGEIVHAAEGRAKAACRSGSARRTGDSVGRYEGHRPGRRSG